MGILSVGCNNIKLFEANLMKLIPKLFFIFRLMTWHNRPKQRKAFKKDISKELMSVARHPTKWRDWCMSKDDKKEIEQFFINEKYYKVVSFASTKINTHINYQ